jgi:hypothetical protein
MLAVIGIHDYKGNEIKRCHMYKLKDSVFVPDDFKLQKGAKHAKLDQNKLAPTITVKSIDGSVAVNSNVLNYRTRDVFGLEVIYDTLVVGESEICISVTQERDFYWSRFIDIDIEPRFKDMQGVVVYEDMFDVSYQYMHVEGEGHVFLYSYIPELITKQLSVSDFRQVIEEGVFYIAPKEPSSKYKVCLDKRLCNKLKKVGRNLIDSEIKILYTKDKILGGD